MALNQDLYRVSRAPHGARGLKSVTQVHIGRKLCRAPHGARGLKFGQNDLRLLRCASRPARGAWIEIGRSRRMRKENCRSRPARGAWIEILLILPVELCQTVAPRTGRVD